MKKTLVALAVALGSTTAFADKQAVTDVLTAQSPMTQGMAMVLANQMQEQGAQVDILPGTISSEADRVYLLCGEASLALNRRQAHVLLSRGGEFDFTIRPEHVRLADSGISV